MVFFIFTVAYLFFIAYLRYDISMGLDNWNSICGRNNGPLSNGMIYSTFCSTHRSRQSIKENNFAEVITHRNAFDWYGESKQKKTQRELNFLANATGTFTKRKLHFAAGFFLPAQRNVRNLFSVKEYAVPHAIRLPINYIAERARVTHIYSVNPKTVEWSACDYDKFKRTTGFSIASFMTNADRIHDSQQFAI